MSRYELHGGDCRDVLARFSEASIDACVTDPPYELGFMGKEWDRAGVAFDPGTWRAVLRVLKPGAHLLAFGGTRTFHRMTCAIEDAGFEIRDCLSWMYGTGFPKSLDVSKAIDKEAGAERTEAEAYDRYRDGGSRRNLGETGGAFLGLPNGNSRTLPASEAAVRWSGWGTALKPAWEPIILARKPLAGTVAANVLAHGAGALNIDACRIPLNGEAAPHGSGKGSPNSKFGQVRSSKGEHPRGGFTPESGRWPANVVLDEDAAAALDAQAGFRGGGFVKPSPRLRPQGNAYGDLGEMRTPGGYDEGGSASRFFYCAKVSPEERLLALERLYWRTDGDSPVRIAQAEWEALDDKDRARGNIHPTIKPVELMRWLVRLVTPPGGIVLDPFMGSGSTGVASIRDGLRFVGIERDDHYREDIARPRLDAESAQGNLFAAEGAR